MAVTYYFKVFIPSLNRRVSFKEITIRDLISINKSIINNDFEEIVDCFDNIINSCCLEKGIYFTLIDKILILLSIRAYSISVFCTLKIYDKDDKKDFEHTLEINDIINKLTLLPIEHKKNIALNELDIEYGIPLYPIKNTEPLQIIDYLHNIKYKDKIIADFKDKNLLQTVIDGLDCDLLSIIQEYIKKVENVFKDNPIYEIRSPFSASRIIITQLMTLDFSLYELLKMLFTENLHNLYRSIYNFNQDLKISPEYVEGLIPVEKDLLWGYYQKDLRDAEIAKNLNTKTGTFSP